MNSFKHPIKGLVNIDELSPNALLQIYLMASYMYYKCFENLMEDDEFDYVCKRLLQEYDKIGHEHKYLVSKADLRAGTGYAIKEYPLRVMIAADMWAKDSYDNVN